MSAPMRNVLHLITRPNDPKVDAVIAAQSNDPNLRIVVVKLADDGADYQAILEKIFEADSVSVW